jgi:hypothetical protein
MVNSDAPIIPGKSAASIKLGEKMEDVLQRTPETFVAKQESQAGVAGVIRYRSRHVDLWAKNGVIWQIMVHNGYAGLTLGKIGLGSTLVDVENLLGPVVVISDNQVVKGIPGISFEPQMDMRHAPIVEIYVWEPDWVEIRNHQTL